MTTTPRPQPDRILTTALRTIAHRYGTKATTRRPSPPRDDDDAYPTNWLPKQPATRNTRTDAAAPTRRPPGTNEPDAYPAAWLGATATGD